MSAVASATAWSAAWAAACLAGRLLQVRERRSQFHDPGLGRLILLLARVESRGELGDLGLLVRDRLAGEGCCALRRALSSSRRAWNWPCFAVTASSALVRLACAVWRAACLAAMSCPAAVELLIECIELVHQGIELGGQ